MPNAHNQRGGSLTNALLEIQRSTALAEYVLAVIAGENIQEKATALAEYLDDAEFAFRTLSNIAAGLREVFPDRNELLARITSLLQTLGLDQYVNIDAIIGALNYFANAHSALNESVATYSTLLLDQFTGDWRAIALEVEADLLSRIIDWRSIHKYVDMVPKLLEALNGFSDGDIERFAEFDMSFLRGTSD